MPGEKKAIQSAVIWRGIQSPGHEYCRLSRGASGWHLAGIAVFVHETQPCRLDYTITCNETWQTQSARVDGRVGNTQVAIDLKSSPDRDWYLNGVEQPHVNGCIDLDLNFSPSTNLIPIRRLVLAIGAQADITAAWLRFPSFTLEPLPQRYTRAGEYLYRYESRGGSFVVDLKVNATGFALDYPGIWLAEATSGS